jgi:hypothetical protein
MDVLLTKLPEDIVIGIILPYAYCPQSSELLRDIRDYFGSMRKLATCTRYYPYENMAHFLYWHSLPTLMEAVSHWYTMRTGDMPQKHQCLYWLRKIHHSDRFRMYWGMLSPSERETSIQGICVMNGWATNTVPQPLG